MDLAGKSVTVVGLAKSGVSAALLLKERGAEVRATDMKQAADLGTAARQLEEAGVRLFLGGHPDEALDGASLVVTSPGIPKNSRPLAEACARGVETIGELELAWRLLPPGVSVIAITGSNGKSTTTSLTAHLLEASGIPAWMGGNIGTPLCELVRAFAPRPGLRAVVEVSSFMLETAPTFAPAAAAILNVSPNHLDRHEGLAEYAEIKARIWRNAGDSSWTVFNRDDSTVAAAAARAPGRHVSFGRGPAPDAGGAGFEWSPGQAEVTFRLPGGPIEERGGAERRVGSPTEGRRADRGRIEHYDLAGFSAPGAHNAANAAAAILLARLAGADPAAIATALASFRPLEHRLEPCGEALGVRFYNDSKATTAEALANSLRVFAEETPRKLVVIAGGRDKGGDFSALHGLFASRAKRLVTFGTAKDLIARAAEGSTDVLRAADLSGAFALAVQDLEPGDVVLFSPACASYDQFSDFEARGRAFKALVAGHTAAGASDPSGGGAA